MPELTLCLAALQKVLSNFDHLALVKAVSFSSAEKMIFGERNLESMYLFNDSMESICKKFFLLLYALAFLVR